VDQGGTDLARPEQSNGQLRLDMTVRHGSIDGK
jgi:hypothetical protein